MSRSRNNKSKNRKHLTKSVIPTRTKLSAETVDALLQKVVTHPGVSPPIEQKTSSEKVGFTELLEIVYRDVQLADAKAGFAITIAALGVAAAASFFGSMPDPDRRALVLTKFRVNVPIIGGLIFSFFGIVFATLAVLPRRYIRQNLSIQGLCKRTFWTRCRNVFGDLGRLIWYSLSFDLVEDGGEYWHNELFKAWSNCPDSEKASHDAMHGELGRILEVRKRKYWWVGPAIIATVTGLLAMLIGVVIAVYVIVSTDLVDRKTLESRIEKLEASRVMTPANEVSQDGESQVENSQTLLEESGPSAGHVAPNLDRPGDATEEHP
jgi:hypothetical protein